MQYAESVIPTLDLKDFELDFSTVAYVFLGCAFVAALLALFVIDRVSKTRTIFPSVVAGAVVWVVATAVLSLGAVFLAMAFRR